MKKQAFNPYLPGYEYIPDGEPHIFDGRVYVYGSHDRFNGGGFCLNAYVCYSAPEDDLSDWRFEGYIYSRLQDPDNTDPDGEGMAAPDVAKGPDGRYYLYYFYGKNNKMGVAVCDSPAGKYAFYGHVRYADGTPIGHADDPMVFDPGIFVDDDGEIYLYSGFALTTNPLMTRGRKVTLQGPLCFRLEKDMLTVKEGPVYIGVGPRDSTGTSYEGHEFLEASSMRKFEGKYYFVYSSQLSHELCYAVSDHPDRDFTYGGTLVSNGDIGLGPVNTQDANNFTGNTHGSLICIRGKYYVFYHRQTNRYQFSRQACAEEIRFENGKFYQAEMTSCGLNGGPLSGTGTYPARIACNLKGKRGTLWYIAIKHPKLDYPYFTQDGSDREDYDDQHIANFCDGAMAGFKYFDLRETTEIRVRVRGEMKGVMEVYTDLQAEPVAAVYLESPGIHSGPVNNPMRYVLTRAERAMIAGIGNRPAPVFTDGADLLRIPQENKEKLPLYFIFRGRGHFDFWDFTLS